MNPAVGRWTETGGSDKMPPLVSFELLAICPAVVTNFLARHCPSANYAAPVVCARVNIGAGPANEVIELRPGRFSSPE